MMSDMIGRTAVMLLVVFVWAARADAGIQLLSSASGVPLGGTANAATLNVGNVNGLALGSLPAGLVVASLPSGPVYSSALTINLNGWGNGASITVSAYVSVNFVHGGGTSPAIAAMHCEAADCTAANTPQALSTASGAPSVIRTGVADNTSFTSNVGALVAALNGASAFSGADSATITYIASDLNHAGKTASATLALSATMQQVVQLSIDGAGAVPVGMGASSDYLADFGTVDGLGVSSANGAAISVTAAGASYSSAYAIRPAFSGMTSSTGTLRMYVSANFAHPGLLQLQDSSSGLANTFAAISSNASQPTVITTTAQSKVSITRYLGLFVFNFNGAGAFSGSDSAVVTYTLIVP